MQPSNAVKLVYHKANDTPISVYSIPETSVNTQPSQLLQTDNPETTSTPPLDQPDPASIYVNTAETLRKRTNVQSEQPHTSGVESLTVSDNVIQDHALRVGEDDTGLVITIKPEPGALGSAAVLVETALNQD